MTIFQRLEKFVKDVFKTSLEVFFEALRLSPNAQGYVSGSITELLLKQHLEHRGFEVKRIREKWEGTKHPNHHGDFYFRKPIGKWFVLESKGVNLAFANFKKDKRIASLRKNGCKRHMLLIILALYPCFSGY